MSPGSEGALVVPRRFRGPATSGNGGWTAGSLAALLPGGVPVRVRLSAPPPLDTPMAVAPDGAGDLVASTGDGTVVARASALRDDEAPPELAPVAFEHARAAGGSYAGLDDHPFPECFVCGTARQPGDGLRLRPGPVGEGRVAAAWVPGPAEASGGAVPVPVVWAALDCPGGWSVDIAGRPMVLGTMTASVRTAPVEGESCVVVGQALEVTDRKARTATTLFGGEGQVLATAAHVWVAVDPARFGAAP